MALAEEFPALSFEGPDRNGILTVCLDRPEHKNALTLDMHRQLAEVWIYIGHDPAAKVVLVRGAGDTFSAGGDYEMLDQMIADEHVRIRVLEEARSLVLNMTDFGLPVVSAIRGPAVGAGLAVALLADVSVAAESARLLDGHVRIGVAAGDHGALLWPMLCGMAKAKRYLLLPDPISGAEAERIGLVSMCVPDDRVEAEAYELARRLALLSGSAVRWTKRALNGWLQAARPIFDEALAFEFLGFGGRDAREGLDALRERRAPAFVQPLKPEPARPDMPR